MPELQGHKQINVSQIVLLSLPVPLENRPNVTLIEITRYRTVGT